MNTTETNKKLAEFLGRDKIEMLSRYIVDDSWLTDEMTDTYKFNSDWNWIMLITNKIEETNKGTLTIQSKGIVYISFNGETFSFHSNNLIGNVYEACGMFVDWYNSQKP